ncbi:MAG: glutathione S-transferase N-terminal domain-containing protein [Myxococcota bacterium]|nr:glutathione S-transferase N-terminal domain-containing protein [Myxococcota bacterium]
MIDAYAWTTPNGQKLLIALEELGLPYNLKWVDLGKGEQKRPEFLAINPNHKIPAIVDHEDPSDQPISVFESGAVLVYLAEKAGQWPQGRDGFVALEWMFFNAGGPGPMTGQLYYYKNRPAGEEEPKAVEKFTTEVNRLFGVLERRLGESAFLAGPAFTVVDIMNFTWPHAAITKLGLDVATYPNVKRWYEAIAARPAVQRALALKPT